MNFDRLAPIYRWMEWFSFGPYLRRARCAFLPEMAEARTALILGDGDGRFTAALLHANRHIQIDAVDISQAMLHALVQRAGSDVPRVNTQVKDIRAWTPLAGSSYDLVVTHFFLDCLTTEEVRGLVERVWPSLAPGARWVVSEFAVPAGPFGRWVAAPVVRRLYGAFGMLTGLSVQQLPDWPSALEGAGFVRAKRRSMLRGLLTSQLWTVQDGNHAANQNC